MHDIRAIRENPAAFDAALARRGKAPVSSQILALDSERRACIQEAEAAQADINSASKQVGAAKAREVVAGLREMIALTRRKLGPERIILVNGLRTTDFRELLDWEGIDDDKGAPAPVTPDAVEALMEIWQAAAAFERIYARPIAEIEAEKNA